MFENAPQQLVNRMLAASHAIGVTDALRDLADDVAGWDAEGCTSRQIDHRIREWVKGTAVGYDAFLVDVYEPLCRDIPEAVHFDPQKLWRAFGVEDWLVECARSIAFTDEPIAFLPLAAGYWMHIPDPEVPMLVAVMTPLSDPELGARQMKEKYAEVFGKKAARSTRRDEVENARMLGRFNSGMSYRDIAIQNLRDEHPDIVERPSKYKAVLKTERERVVKAVSAARELWKERFPESSTPE